MDKLLFYGGIMMVVTGKKVGIFVGSLSILTSIFMVISNRSFDMNFSYVAIGTGLFSGCMLVMLSSKKRTNKN